MNPKVKKVLFALTFLPYAAVILLCLWGTFFGLEFFGTNYGFDGFVTGLVYSFMYMVVLIPVLPVCVVFHILCLIRKIPFVKRISTKIFAVICVIICTAAAAIPFIHLI